MNQVNNYRTVCEAHCDALDAVVNKLIKQGWQPFGNPYIATKADDFNICQSMVLLAPNILTESNPRIGAQVG